MNKTSKPFIEGARGSIFRVVATGLTVSSIALAGLVGSVQPSVADNVVRCAYPFWFGFAPAPVADAMGYYEEEGIEFEAVFDNDRANVLPGLESGEINCTMRTIGEHISRPMSADSNLVVIGLIDISVGADGVVGAPGIDSVTDLVGKTFAGEINHPGTVMTAFALKQAGYSLDDIDMRMIATDDSPGDLRGPRCRCRCVMGTDVERNRGEHVAQGIEDPAVLQGFQRLDHGRCHRQPKRLRGQQGEV